MGTTIFAFTFPIIFIIYLIFKKPKDNYEIQHCSRIDPIGLVNGYESIKKEIFEFTKNHLDGDGFQCSCLCSNNIINPYFQIFPLDKREFLQSNTEAAKLYLKCMVQHIAWSRGVIPYEIRNTYKSIDPYKEYYDKFGGLEKLYYRDQKTYYKRNCIRSQQNKLDDCCKHCQYAQHKIAKSYFAQRLVNYKQDQKNLTDLFGKIAYTEYNVAHNTEIGFITKNCSDEGLKVSKWNCSFDKKSDLEMTCYQDYNVLENLKIVNDINYVR